MSSRKRDSFAGGGGAFTPQKGARKKKGEKVIDKANLTKSADDDFEQSLAMAAEKSTTRGANPTQKSREKEVPPKSSTTNAWETLKHFTRSQGKKGLANQVSTEKDSQLDVTSKDHMESPTGSPDSANCCQALTEEEQEEEARREEEHQRVIDQFNEEQVDPENTNLNDQEKTEKEDNHEEEEQQDSEEEEQEDEEDDPAASMMSENCLDSSFTETEKTDEDETWDDIRHNAWLATPPSKKPFEDASRTLKLAFAAIQEVLGSNFNIGTWGPEMDSAHGEWKSPDDAPDGSAKDRTKFSAMLGTNHFNPRINMEHTTHCKIRFVIDRKSLVPLCDIGEALNRVFGDIENGKFAVSRNPIPCQSTAVECVGWLHCSSKTMTEGTLHHAICDRLGVKDDGNALGVQWRTVCKENGKCPNCDPSNPNGNPGAIHLDVATEHAYRARIEVKKLWRVSA